MSVFSATEVAVICVGLVAYLILRESLIVMLSRRARRDDIDEGNFCESIKKAKRWEAPYE